MTSKDNCSRFFFFFFFFMDIPHPQPQPQQTCLHFHILHMGPTKYHSSFLFHFFFFFFGPSGCGNFVKNVEDFGEEVLKIEMAKLLVKKCESLRTEEVSWIPLGISLNY